MNCAMGCGSWSAGSFQWRGRSSKICERCALAKERAAIVESVGVPVRDVNAIGLGDRRGLAIEESVLVPSDPHRPRFIVYVEGYERLRRTTWDQAYRDGVERAKGRGL